MGADRPHRRATETRAPAEHTPKAGRHAHAVAYLQASAGNAAVSALLSAAPVVQRDVACPPAPPAPAGVRPQADPRFRAVTAKVHADARRAKAHRPAAAEVGAAQQAALAPPDHKEAQAKAAKTAEMNSAQPGAFDKAAFMAAVNAAVAAQAPRNLDEADNFATSGKPDQIRTQALDKVNAGKQSSARDITQATAKSPDTGAVPDKPVTPLAPAPPAPALTPPDPRLAVPDKAPPEQTDLRAQQCETHGVMAEAGVTDEQLAKAGEPAFTEALDAKRAGEEHTATAPAAVRAGEAKQLAGATSAAGRAGRSGVAGMLGAHALAAQHTATGKQHTKAGDESERARIAGELKAVVDATQTDVQKLLTDLDTQVDQAFTKGEREAKEAFTADHKARMDRYKDDRYSGVTGWARWSADLFTGLPAEANQIFLASRRLYESKMQAVIAGVADLIGAQLGKAKARIAAGRQEVAKKVSEQPAALRGLARAEAQKFDGRFEELTSSVDAKQQQLVDDLAQKYVAARNAVDEEIKRLQEENKGLWDKAKDAVVGAVETILKLKDLLLGALARAAAAIDLIIRDPIGFLGNLVDAVKTGVVNFAGNIATHLKNGLKAWLLGNLAEAGIEIPETFDLRGILTMILSLLGLTWANVRARILRFIPEPVLKALEGSLGVVRILVAEGLPGLWQWVLEKVGDLKELVLGQIKSFVIEKIVKAGITWIISLLNPAAAFIKACKAIYDIVMFLVEKAGQIKEFVDAVLDSVESIARGGAGAVAGLIERTLAKALPMVIGFLASLLGLGGISDKIRSVLGTVQAPVTKAIDGVVGTIVKAGKNMIGKLGRGKDDDTPEGKQKRLDAGMAAAVGVVNRFSGKFVGQRLIGPLLTAVRFKYRMTELSLVAKNEKWVVKGVVNPEAEAATDAKAIDPEKVRAAIAAARGQFGIAEAEYAKVQATEPSATVAAGNGTTRREGGGSLAEARSDPAAARRYLEADAARWEELGKAHGEHLDEMLTPLNKPTGKSEMSKYRYPVGSRADQTERVRQTGEYLPMRTFKDRGVPGRTEVVHAEILVYKATSAEAIGVSRAQCAGCQNFFGAQAQSEQKFLVVAGPDAVRVFLPDGSVKGPADFA